MVTMSASIIKKVNKMGEKEQKGRELAAAKEKKRRDDAETREEKAFLAYDHIRFPFCISVGVYSPSGGDSLPYFNRHLSQLMFLYQKPGEVITSG